MSDSDVVVIGDGAAGLSAALVLTRARRRVLVVDAGVPRNAHAAHGFISGDCLPPGDLLALGRAEVTGYGGEVLPGTACELMRCGTAGFWVLLADGRRLSARRLLVATGPRDELPDLPARRTSRAGWPRSMSTGPSTGTPEFPSRTGPATVSSSACG